MFVCASHFDLFTPSITPPNLESDPRSPSNLDFDTEEIIFDNYKKSDIEKNMEACLEKWSCRFDVRWNRKFNIRCLRSIWSIDASK